VFLKEVHQFQLATELIKRNNFSLRHPGEKRCVMALKTRKDFPKTVHISKTKLPKNVKQPDFFGFFAIRVDLFEFRFRR
jgi:hypothetical protein